MIIYISVRKRPSGFILFLYQLGWRNTGKVRDALPNSIRLVGRQVYYRIFFLSLRVAAYTLRTTSYSFSLSISRYVLFLTTSQPFENVRVCLVARSNKAREGYERME